MNTKMTQKLVLLTFIAWKLSKYGVISGPYFPVFGLNTEIYCVKSVQIRKNFWSVFSCIQTEYIDLRSKSPYSVWIQGNTDQKYSVFGHFPCSVWNNVTPGRISELETSKEYLQTLSYISLSLSLSLSALYLDLQILFY